MNIEATIARIPAMTADQRKTLRTNAEAKLASDDPQWTDAALKVITALDALDAEEGRIANAARSSRLGNLDGCSPIERIVIAFELDPISPGEDKLIQTLLDHPGSTCAELSRRHGWEETAWDMQYGYMCAKRQEYLWPLEPDVREELKPNIDMLTVKTRGEDGILRYSNRPEATDAFRRLGFRIKSEIASPSASNLAEGVA